MSLPISRIPDPHDAPALRWGILAPGGIAHSFANAVRTHTRQEIVAVGSRSKDRSNAFGDEFDIERRYDSYDELVVDDGIDAIYVASPTATTASMLTLPSRPASTSLWRSPSRRPLTRHATWLQRHAARESPAWRPCGRGSCHTSTSSDNYSGMVPWETSR